MFRAIILSGVAVGVVLLGACRTAVAAPIELKPGQKQLFLDDYVIDKIDGVSRTMHQVRKHPGNPVIRPEYPWEENRVVINDAPVWNRETRRWELRYGCHGLIRDQTPLGYTTATCLAVSQDGLRWEKPMLDLYKFREAKKTNIIYYAENSKEGLFGAVYEPDDPDPECRWKALLGYRNLKPATSADGIHWMNLSDKPVEKVIFSKIVRDESDRKYLAVMRVSSDKGRAIGLSSSEDFIKWTIPELVFNADRRDQELGRQWLERHLADPTKHKPSANKPESFSAEIYGMAIFPYEGLYIGLPMMYYQCNAGPGIPAGDGFSDIQLAVSRDLRNWQRLGDRAAFIPLSSLGGKDVYDVNQIMPPSCPVCRDGELWFYYGGYKYRVPDKAQDESDVSAICLAKLRLDGFASIDACESEGTVLTKPILWHGQTLWVNVDASGGELSVEVLDADGKLFDGKFSKEQAIPIDNDGVRLPARWKGGAALGELEGKTVRLRFHLRKVSLYAFWSEGE